MSLWGGRCSYGEKMGGSLFCRGEKQGCSAMVGVSQEEGQSSQRVILRERGIFSYTRDVFSSIAKPKTTGIGGTRKLQDVHVLVHDG